MTRDTFRALMLDPNTPAQLDAMLAEDARTDAERAERERCQRNEEIVIRYLRHQWRLESQWEHSR